MVEMICGPPASAVCVEQLSAVGQWKAKTQKTLYRMPEKRH